MDFLSGLFFWLSPFALFCSPNGTGLILCPTFIILGFVFKWIKSKPKKVTYINNKGEKSSYKTKTYKNGDTKIIVDVPMQNFWEWHYKDRMRSILAQKDSINDGLMALKDEEARRWATAICRYHNAWVPSEDIQEQIAKANGVITEKMVKASAIKKDRIQIGKYFLMCELKLKYEKLKRWRESIEIKKDMGKIKISRCRGADDWYVKQQYGKTVSEMWDSLSLDEKQQAEEWVKEYEDKLIQAVKNYENHTELTIHPVNMDF